MKLTVFGNNASWPAANGACACYWLETAKANILLDMGSGALAKVQQKKDIAALDLIVISHLHFDHIGDLFCAKYQLETRLAAGEDIHPVPVLCPELPYVLEKQLKEGGVFELFTVRDGMVYHNPPLGVSIEFFAMRHLVESYGIRLQSGGRVLAYSGDTGPCENLEKVAKGADLFLCEASLVKQEGEEAAHHLPVPRALEAARRAGAKRLLLTHYRPENAEMLQSLLEASRRDYEMEVTLSGIMEEYPL